MGPRFLWLGCQAAGSGWAPSATRGPPDRARTTPLRHTLQRLRAQAVGALLTRGMGSARRVAAAEGLHPRGWRPGWIAGRADREEPHGLWPGRSTIEPRIAGSTRATELARCGLAKGYTTSLPQDTQDHHLSSPFDACRDAAPTPTRHSQGSRPLAWARDSSRPTKNACFRREKVHASASPLQKPAGSW